MTFSQGEIVFESESLPGYARCDLKLRRLYPRSDRIRYTQYSRATGSQAD